MQYKGSDQEQPIKPISLHSPILTSIIQSLPDGEVEQVNIGLHWTAVVLEVYGQQRCGLSSSLCGQHTHGEPELPQAGQLQQMTALELASYAFSDTLIRASVGVAAINALLPQQPQSWLDINAEDVIAREGEGKNVALIGHFPFVPRLRQRLAELVVIEQQPQPGDYPAEAAVQVLPRMDVVAITGTALINHTIEQLLAACKPQAVIIVLGPSTFLSPIMFDFGVDLLCGSVVTDIPAVIKMIQQGGNFRQLHQAGVRLVSMKKPAI